MLSTLMDLVVRREARECRAPSYEGCIVARRKLRYVPRARLRLPITLYAHCEGIPCDADTTCNALGVCVPTLAIDCESHRRDLDDERGAPARRRVVT